MTKRVCFHAAAPFPHYHATAPQNNDSTALWCHDANDCYRQNGSVIEVML